MQNAHRPQLPNHKAPQRQNRPRKIPTRSGTKKRHVPFPAVGWIILAAALFAALALCFGKPAEKENNPEKVVTKKDHLSQEDVPDAERNQYTEEARQDPNDPLLLLVNKKAPLPDGYEDEITLMTLENGHRIDERAADDLKEMLHDARSCGLSPIICSSYRTEAYQTALFDRELAQQKAKGLSETEARKEAEKWVAVPGTSEHQTGLAVDLVAESYQLLDEAQEQTDEQQWLMDNSYRYGFILRYPTDRSEITGIHYEPWHYRYVGKAAAKEIYDAEMTLEEYVQSLREAADESW